MSSITPLASAHRRVAVPRLALLGTGVVGSAFVERYQHLHDTGLVLPAFSWLANSRAWQACDGSPQLALRETSAATAISGPLPPWADAESFRRGDVVVDATGSESVADGHADWLARGVHVVTANKLGMGSTQSRAVAIAQALRTGGASYGNSATVGAGLPLLRSLRELVAGGDRIHRVEGVLSGSLAWLFGYYDGMRHFSGFVREARRLGYTEPDPRLDLSGEDVRRKLLILARTAGHPLQAEDVEVDSLVPPELASLALDEVDETLTCLDAPLAARFKAAHRSGARLRFLGRFDAQGARVGLQDLNVDHPLCGGSGTDNRVAIFSDRYADQPLVIQGPGAGAQVTAAALLDDVLRIVRA